MDARAQALRLGAPRGAEEERFLYVHSLARRGAFLGATILAAYGVVAALQPISEFGRVYAAYGGVFIALALAWGVVVDGFRPDKWDLLGVAICVVGVAVMVAPPRG